MFLVHTGVRVLRMKVLAGANEMTPSSSATLLLYRPLLPVTILDVLKPDVYRYVHVARARVPTIFLFVVGYQQSHLGPLNVQIWRLPDAPAGPLTFCHVITPKNLSSPS